jgi:NAD(P)-dependent dehydrogenase (short-subunit alcohol dehydrogenase family)
MVKRKKPRPRATSSPSSLWTCHMLAQGKGSIVNPGSMSGLIVNRPQTAASYMASKGAVHMLTKALARD